MINKISEIPYICDQWSALVKNDPEAVFLTEETSGDDYTRQQADELSGQVYGWLVNNGIGKEDFVLIILPRDARPFISMLGVWKAGAAFILLEDDYVPDRVEAIKRECECRIEINAETWHEIMNTPSRSGFVRADDHDLCFAIYTSGSTGRPKGVLHEYGRIRWIQASMEKNMSDLVDNGTVMGMRVPLYFIVAVRLFLNAINGGMRIVVMTRETGRDPVKMNALFLKYNVSFTYLTPSILRVIQGSPARCLKVIMSGGEPANDIWVEGVKVINNYAMSETGFPIAQFVLDKRYDTAPAGKPVFDDFNIRILDEKGCDVPDGEKGEICFENPFFRGYRNLPEETEKALRFGIFHTGDMGLRNPDGNISITSRISTLIKINGNRVEPGEIEAVLRKLPGIGSAVVKDFTMKRHRVFLCAYYTADSDFPYKKLRNHLAKHLPHYMIPAFFMRLDKIPLNRNGKVDRFALPAPDVNAGAKPYAAPRTPEEERICKAFEKTLNVERVGIHDDFFDLGGDSVSTAILAAGLADLQVEYRDVYSCRTPERISYCVRKKGISDLTELNKIALTRYQYPTPFQTFFYDAQLNDLKQTGENNFIGLRFSKDVISAGQLKAALETVFKQYSIFGSVLTFNHDGELVWQYVPDKIVPVEITPVTGDIDEVIMDFIKPFRLNHELLYRCRIFTKDDEIILAMDISHIIADGTMMRHFMEELSAAYCKKALRDDHYYYYLDSSHASRMKLEKSREVRRLREMYNKKGYRCNPSPDISGHSAVIGVYQAKTNHIYRDYEQHSKVLNTSINRLFVAAALMALSRLEGEPKVSVEWYYNGRDEKWKEDLIGMTLSAIPVAVDFDQLSDPRQVIREVSEQGEAGMRCSDCSLGNSGVTPGDMNRIDIIYQSGFDIEKALPENTKVIRTFDKRNGLYTRMQIVPFDKGKKDEPIMYYINYDANLYSEGLIKRFSGLLNDAMDELK
jgi:acyl-coenzyme A synthetase/AMP-(fatty) acid ligase